MKAVVSVTGCDAVGIIAKVSSVCAEFDVNIVDISQTVLQEYFSMIMVVEISRINAGFNWRSTPTSKTGISMRKQKHLPDPKRNGRKKSNIIQTALPLSRRKTGGLSCVPPKEHSGICRNGSIWSIRKTKPPEGWIPTPIYTVQVVSCLIWKAMKIAGSPGMF